MKAAVTTQYGAPEVIQIQDVPKPSINARELLVKVKAAAVNSGDVRIRALNGGNVPPFVMRLIFGWKKPKSGIQGLMFSGIVEEVGDQVTDFKKGDEVFGSTGMKMGAFAEYVKLKGSDVLVHKPKNASFEEAAALPFGGMTAIHFLHKAGIQVVQKPNVLIYGATGAVGVSAIEVAKYYGAKVTAVCSERGEELVKSLGADHIVLYTQEDYRQINAQFDIVFDAVGKTKKKDVKAILKPNGKYFTVGGMDVASETREQVKLLKSLFEKGQLHANIDKSYSLDDIVDAHTYVDSERKKGNVVLRIA